MRSLAFAAMVVGCAAAGQAAAQTRLSEDSSVLARAAYDSPTAYAPQSLSNQADPIGQMMDREVFVAAGPVRWNTGAVQLSDAASGPVDSLRVSVGGALVTPGGGPVDLDRAQFQPKAYEIAVIRDWPGALTFDSGKFDVDVSPHVGVGVGNSGGSAEGGAKLEISPKSRDERAAEALRGMGVDDGLTFGDQGRWYLFAAVSGRAVGMNMLRDSGDWDRAGWTTDATSTLIGDGQIGVGWRKGAVQSSFGYVHREVKGQHMVFGQKTYDDSLVAFTFSIRPSH